MANLFFTVFHVPVADCAKVTLIFANLRVLISAVFIAIAAFSVFSLSSHQERAEKLWTALEARVAAAPSEFIPEEVAYIDLLQPTTFPIKAGAIIAADMLVVLVIWFSPKIKE